MENKNHIGTKLFKIRNERGETQEHVAECVGITYVSLSRYENGQRMPKMDILARLAEHYGVTVDELMGRDDADTKKEPATDGGHDESSGSVHRSIGSYPKCQWFESVRSH